MVRRICLYGGPGVGKSVLAAKLYAELAAEGRYVDHVTEYIKDWAYQNRKPESYDQFYVFAHQLHREDVRLRYVDAVVTDSPLLLNASYSKQYSFEGWQHILDMCRMFERSFPSCNIILDRKGIEYVEKGRYQTLEQALDVDRHVSDMVYENCPPASIHVRSAKDFGSIKSLVLDYLDGHHEIFP